MSKQIKDVGSSVRARLANIAKNERRSFDSVFTFIYAREIAI